MLSIQVTRLHPSRAPTTWESYAIPFLWLFREIRHFGGLKRAIRRDSNNDK